MASPDAFHIRAFASPDEVVELELLRSEIVTMGAVSIARNVHFPGWRWSVHVRPVVGTEWCETRHVGLCVGGRMGLRMRAGPEIEMSAGQVFTIPPGHDGWVIGDQPVETVDWSGARSWILPLASLKERVLATVVITDIVESTLLAHRVGDPAWAELATAYEESMADSIARFRGQVVKGTGDGVITVFDGATRAVQGAQAMRTAAEHMGLASRASVHTGELELSGEEVRGIVVHEAARMLSVAEPGEILVSAATAALLQEGAVRLRSRGEHLFPGLEGERRVYVVW